MEVLRYLDPARGGLFVDCTVGLGGHAEAILEASDRTELLGFDRDRQALRQATARLEGFGERVRLVRGGFEDLPDLLRAEGIEAAAGILADLGVSSMQLDRPDRGFSFRHDGPLDMRMSDSGPTAADIVNDFSEATLDKIFREYGEETQARRVARAVVRARQERPIETTSELADIVRRAKVGRRIHGRRAIDPATQVFQALRIEVNRELESLDSLLDSVVDLLERDGRLVVISYHSLEDRRVKNKLRDLARGEQDEITGHTLSDTRLIELLTRKPVRPSTSELTANPRARSARLRAARRL